jgi:hypothetical protein
MLYSRISAQDYKEHRGDALAVSGMAESIRGALLDYQVCDNETCAALVPLTRDGLIDDPTTGDIRPEPHADCELLCLCVGNVPHANRDFEEASLAVLPTPSPQDAQNTRSKNPGD